MSAEIISLPRRLVAEFIGTVFLLATVVGSGIMAENLAGGNIAIALLGNTIATGAILYVLITALGPISGAHYNPAVTLIMLLRGEVKASDALLYMGVQTIGGIVGVFLAHAMFTIEVFQVSTIVRSGSGQWLAEATATFGLVFTILMTLKARAEAVPMAVGLYITAGYWFTSSTSFANPAVTIARSLSDTFAGIYPGDVLPFIAAQLVGAVLAHFVCRFLVAD